MKYSFLAFGILAIISIICSKIATSATVQKTANPVTLDARNLELVDYLQGQFGPIFAYANYLYTIRNGSELVVFDISSPNKLVELSNTDIPTNARSIDVAAPYIYIAANESGLYIFDISDPSKPIQASNFDKINALDVNIVDNYAYIAIGEGGLKILDISDSENPIEVGFYDKVRVTSIELNDKYAFVDNYRDQIDIFDISDRVRPIKASSLKYSRRVSVSDDNDDLAYFINSDANLRIESFQNPEIPEMIGFYRLRKRFSPSKILVQNGYAYITQYPSDSESRRGELVILDISDINRIVEIGDARLGGRIAVVDGFIYIANWDGLFILTQHNS